MPKLNVKMATSLIPVLIILLVKYSQQRTSTCGSINCVVEAVNCKVNSNGTQVCNCFVGVSGDACEFDRDECTEHKGRSPCGHRGHCVNGFGSYRCDCLRGWAGLTCRSKTNTEPDDFDCFTGWIGKFCMYDIDECTNGPPPCPGPHEECVNTEGSYNCTCNVGWEGSDCMQDIDECENNPCGEKQMCQNTPGSYACPCLTGWYGVNCDQNVNECVTEPCGPSGTCVDTNGSYVCECSSGFTGNRCKINTSDLPMSPISYAIIGSVSGFALLLLLCAIASCLCMRCKLKDLRQRQEDTRRMKMIHDRTTKVHPSAGPMFSIKRHMDDGLDNKWTTSIKTTLNKNQTSNGNVLRNSPKLTTLAERSQRTRAVKPFDGNTDYNSRPTKTYNSPSDMYQSKMSRDSAQPHTMPVHYGSNPSSDNKGDYGNRPTKTYNSPSDMYQSRMSRDSAQPHTMPVHYGSDPSSDNKGDYSNRPTKTYNSPSEMYQSKMSRDSAQPHTVPVHYGSDPSSDNKGEYTNRPTKTYNSPSDMYQYRMSRDSAQPHTMPVQYGSDQSSDNKGDNNRSSMTYNLSSDMIESRMTSASSLPPTIPVKYDMDPIFNNY